MKRELEAITESGKAVTVVATGGLSTLIDDGGRLYRSCGQDVDPGRA